MRDKAGRLLLVIDSAEGEHHPDNARISGSDYEASRAEVVALIHSRDSDAQNACPTCERSF